MARDGVHHRSAFLVAFEVADHASLAAMDAGGTAGRIARIRSELIDPGVAALGGRLVDEASDGFAAALPGAETAVRFALDVLRAVHGLNADLAADWRIALRVGIAPADGEPPARRIAALAAPGEVCLSRAVRDAVGDEFGGVFLDIGEQYLGGDDMPVQVYRVVDRPAAVGSRAGPALWWRGGASRRAIAALIAVLAVAGLVWWQSGGFRVEPASVARMAFALPDKPSLAVLPFADLAPEAGRGYFAAGVTEDIVARLAELSGLFVIGSGSMRAASEDGAALPRVAEALGVRYVLHGGIARTGDRLSADARLTDATTGKQIWQTRYDGAAQDVFAAEDDIALNVALNLGAKLTQRELERLSRGTGPAVAAYDAVLLGRSLLSGPSANLPAARAAFETAISIDPSFADAHAALSMLHAAEFTRADAAPGPADPLRSSAGAAILEAATRHAERAVALDPGLAAGHAAAARAYLYARRHGAALREIRDAEAAAPGDAMTVARLGWILGIAGSPKRALAHLATARRLSPGDTDILSLQAGTLRAADRTDEAIAAFEELRAKRGDRMGPLEALQLAAAYMQAGREREARATVRSALAAAPLLTTAAVARATPYRRPDVLAATLDALSRAGLPDGAPPPLSERRTLAVLPFASLTAGGRQNYFSAGVAEDIELVLSKVSGLVIAGLAETRRYGSEPIDPFLVSRELGVDSILFGSVSRRGDRLRVFAQLAHSETGNTIWLETYDRPPADIFEVEEEIARKVMMNLAVWPRREERARLVREHKPSLPAYDAYLRGRARLATPTPGNLGAARTLFEQAVKLDPGFSGGYAGLAAIIGTRLQLDGGPTQGADLSAALGLARTAVALDPGSGRARASLAFAQLLGGQYDEALTAIEAAVALAPGDVELRRRFGRYLTLAGRPEEGLGHLTMAHRMAPYSAAGGLMLGEAYRAAGRFGEAVEILEAQRRINGARRDPDAALQLAASYAELGRDADARAEVAALHDMAPHVTLGFLESRLPYRRAEDRRAFLDALRKGGLR